MGTDTTHTFNQSENLPHPSFHFASYPDHSTFARSEDDNRPANAPYAPARVYLFDDSALSAPNTGDEVSPIAKLLIQAARMVATAPLKAKRSKRRTGKKCASCKASSPPEANVSKKTIFTPSKEELLEAGTLRAQEALEVWYKRLGELHDNKKKYGDCNVPQKHPENPSLGTWVNKQRMEYKMNTENLKTGMTPKKLKWIERRIEKLLARMAS
jgi:Helicase associated domain